MSQNVSGDNDCQFRKRVYAAHLHSHFHVKHALHTRQVILPKDLRHLPDEPNVTHSQNTIKSQTIRHKTLIYLLKCIKFQQASAFHPEQVNDKKKFKTISSQIPGNLSDHGLILV